MELLICALALLLLIFGLKIRDLRKTLNEYMKASNERAEHLSTSIDALVDIQILQNKIKPVEVNCDIKGVTPEEVAQRIQHRASVQANLEGI